MTARLAHSAEQGNTATHALCMLLLLSPASSVLPNDPMNNEVNERPPMSNLDLERHWNVDCAATISATLAQLDAREQDCHAHRSGSNASAQSALDALTLCAAVYNPPGDPGARTCPDFRSVLMYMRNMPDHPCAPQVEQRELLRNNLQCLDSIPATH